MTSCHEHGPPDTERLAGELRALAVAVLDRAEPLLTAVREGRAAAGPAAPSSCATCPVCAVLAALRGERPELAVRLAEHATALLAALRALVDASSDYTDDTDHTAHEHTGGGVPPDAGGTAGPHETTTSAPDPVRERQNGAGTGAHSAGRAESPGHRRVQRIPVTRPGGVHAGNGRGPDGPDGAGPGGPPGRT